MPVSVSDNEFALLFTYLAREHSFVFDPSEVGKTTKIGKQLWDRVQEIALEQGFTPENNTLETVEP
jgi:hypothetical protein